MFNKTFYKRPNHSYGFANAAARKYRKSVQICTWSAEQVFAAAVTAQEINSEYLKYPKHNEQGNVTARPNKEVMRELLVNGAEFTAEQIASGNQVRDHYQQLLFEQMSGELKEFLQNALRISSRAEFQSNDWLDLVIVAALPSCAQRDQIRRAAEQKRQELAEQSQLVGKIGDRVEGDAEVIECRWSQKWNCWTVNARLGNNLLFFFHKSEVSGKIKLRGTVKGHRENNVTQLNRVQIVG
jgi:hypothetical protein